MSNPAHFDDCQLPRPHEGPCKRTVDDAMAVAVQKLMDAWVIEGPVPEYHERQKRHLFNQWPMLYRRMEELAALVRVDDE